eukprot:3169_1
MSSLKPKNLIESTLMSKGYSSLQKINDALQGSIWKAMRSNSESPIVIKAINKSLHHRKITHLNDKQVRVDEDIVKESHILKHLTNDDPPLSLTKFVDFFSDSEYFYLAMEHGGTNLFHFVKEAHQCLANGVLPVPVWQSFCKIAMKQMVDLIDWMHNTMKTCHFDISLENFVISNARVSVDVTTKKILNFNNDFQIKIIDFGLAEMFTTTGEDGTIDFSSTKYVGKANYEAPEVYRQEGAFDARNADCWSLGVSFFKMIIGSAPFQRPSSDDALFQIMMNGHLIACLQSWNRFDYITPNMLDLIERMFVSKATNRLNIREIRQHACFAI